MVLLSTGWLKVVRIALLGLATAQSTPCFAEQIPSPLTCTPRTVYTSSELHIHLPVPHGSDLAIIDPTGTYYFLSFDHNSTLIPPISPDIFAKLPNLVISIGEVKGVVWRQVNPRTELVFRRPGRYKIVLSEALETEDPVIDGECYLNYVGRASGIRTDAVLFPFDSAALDASGKIIVADSARAISRLKPSHVDVLGYADRVGTVAYNRSISLRRAERVRAALIADGVPAKILKVIGYGVEHPLLRTPEGMREPQNRRVEITLR